MTVRLATRVERRSRLDFCARPLRESTKASDDADESAVVVSRIAFEKRMLGLARSVDALRLVLDDCSLASGAESYVPGRTSPSSLTLTTADRMLWAVSWRLYISNLLALRSGGVSVVAQWPECHSLGVTYLMD